MTLSTILDEFDEQFTGITWWAKPNGEQDLRSFLTKAITKALEECRHSKDATSIAIQAEAAHQDVGSTHFGYGLAQSDYDSNVKAFLNNPQ